MTNVKDKENTCACGGCTCANDCECSCNTCKCSESCKCATSCSCGSVMPLLLGLVAAGAVGFWLFKDAKHREAVMDAFGKASASAQKKFEDFKPSGK